MATNEPLSPPEFLKSLIGQKVVVKSKWGPQYVATLISIDAYLNLQLQDCTEYASIETFMEEVVIRCNNVLYIRQAPPGVEKPIV